MSTRRFSNWSAEEEEEIGPSSSKKSSSERQPSKIKEIMSNSMREMAENIKEKINNEIIVKSGEDQTAVDVELTETDWTTVNVKTIVNDRIVEVRSPTPKKSSSSKSSSKSSSEAANLRKTLSSTPLVEGKGRNQTFSSPLDLPGPNQALLSSTMIHHTPDTPITKKTNVGGQNTNITKKKNIFEKNGQVSKNRKSSTRVENVSTDESKKIIDENLNSFNRDAEITREAVLFADDIANLDQPIFLNQQHLSAPDSPKKHTNVVEYVEATIRENPFDDDAIDQSDNDSGEFHVCPENLKTYPTRWADVIRIGMQVPRIVKRSDVYILLEKSPVIPPPGQTPSPPMIKFHPADNLRANQLWDEFSSANSEIFSKNVSSHPVETNEGQNTKRRFFKTGLKKSGTREVPQKNRKKSRTKRAKKVESPKKVTIHGRLNFAATDRTIFEVWSDSDDDWAVSSKSPTQKRLRFDDREEGQSSKLRKKTTTVEERCSKRTITEASGSRSVSGNDRRPKRTGFAERMRRRALDAASSSAIVGSPCLRDRYPCDRGAQTDRTEEILTEESHTSDTEVDESAVSRTRGKRNREIESVYDEGSAIADLDSTNPKGILETVESMDLIVAETAIRDVPENPRNRGDIGEAVIDESPIGDLGNESPTPDLDLLFSRIDRVLGEIGWEARHDSSTAYCATLTSKQGVPIIQSDVVLSAKVAKKVDGRWEIDHLLASPK